MHRRCPVGRFCRVRSPGFIGQPLQQTSSFFLGTLEIPEDVFNQDHRRVDNDSEIDRAERKEIGALALQDDESDGKEQRKRDVQPDDDGASQVAQENPLNQEDQKAAKNQVVQDGMGGDRDERPAIIKGDQPDARGQTAVMVHLVDFSRDLGQHVDGLSGPAHDHDTRHRVVILVPAPNAQPGAIADRDFRDVLDPDRNAVLLAQDNIFDVIHLVALHQIVVAPVVDQPDAPDVDRLLANGDFAPADIDIGVAQGGDDLRHRQAISFELVRMDIDIELLGRSAPTIDRHDTGNGQEPPGHDPILDRAKIRQPDMLVALHLIAENFAGSAVLLDAGHLVSRQGHVLLQRDGGLAIGEIVIDAILENDADEGEAVEGGRANDLDAGRGIKADLDGTRVVTLHFLRGQARRLGGDFQDDRRRIRIGLDVETLKGAKTGAGKEQQAEYNDGATAQAKGNERLEHGVRRGRSKKSLRSNRRMAEPAGYCSGRRPRR